MFKVGDQVKMRPYGSYEKLLDHDSLHTLIGYADTFRKESDHSSPFTITRVSSDESGGSLWRGQEVIMLSSPKKHRSGFWVPAVAFQKTYSDWLEDLPLEVNYAL